MADQSESKRNATIWSMSRTTPDTSDLMPEVLELLKRQGPIMTKAEIAKHMQNWITANGYAKRDRSIAWALNRLAGEGYIDHPQHGAWRITEKGLSSIMTAEEAHAIVERRIERERAARRTRLKSS